MRLGVRVLVALGLGFVVYRIGVDVISTEPTAATAVVLGLIVAGCTWALTGPRRVSPAATPAGTRRPGP